MDDQIVWIAARLTVPRWNHLIHLTNSWSINAVEYTHVPPVMMHYHMWRPGGDGHIGGLVDDGGQFVILIAELTQPRASHLLALISAWSFSSLEYPQGLIVERIRNWLPGWLVNDIFVGGGEGGGGDDHDHDHDHDNGGDDHEDGGDDHEDEDEHADDEDDHDHDDDEDDHDDEDDNDDDGDEDEDEDEDDNGDDDSMLVDGEGKAKQVRRRKDKAT